VIAAAVRAILARTAPPATASRDVVEADVATLVAQQIAAMPTFLRLPYRAGLTCFDALPLLRWGRRFRDLDPPRRDAWITAWDESRIGATHSFVKLIRSCTLLAWFDDPRVTSTSA
jgi:hypothetical protein